MPRTKDIERARRRAEESAKALEDWAVAGTHDCRHVCYQFGIKMYGVDLPEEAYLHLDEQQRTTAAEAHIQSALEDYARSAMERYPWIQDWWQAGRSGGWLVLQPHGGPIEAFLNRERLDDEEVLGLSEQMDARISDLAAIGAEVKSGKAAVEADLSSFDWWQREATERWGKPLRRKRRGLFENPDRTRPVPSSRPRANPTPGRAYEIVMSDVATQPAETWYYVGTFAGSHYLRADPFFQGGEMRYPIEEFDRDVGFGLVSRLPSADVDMADVPLGAIGTKAAIESRQRRGLFPPPAASARGEVRLNRSSEGL